jgi:hypothetical protein
MRAIFDVGYFPPNTPPQPIDLELLDIVDQLVTVFAFR